MSDQKISITKEEHQAIEVDRFKHRIAEHLLAWQAAMRKKGIHIDPITGSVTLQK